MNFYKHMAVALMTIGSSFAQDNQGPNLMKVGNYYRLKSAGQKTDGNATYLMYIHDAVNYEYTVQSLPLVDAKSCDNSIFLVRQGLDLQYGTKQTISLENHNKTGHFLTHSGQGVDSKDQCWLKNKYEITDKQDASFIELSLPSRDSVKLASVNHPTYLVSEDNQRVVIEEYQDYDTTTEPDSQWVPEPVDLMDDACKRQVRTPYQRAPMGTVGYIIIFVFASVGAYVFYQMWKYCKDARECEARNVASDEFQHIESVRSLIRNTMQIGKQYVIRMGEPLKFKPGKIEIEAEWFETEGSDGNQQSKLYLKLERNKMNGDERQVIHQLDIFGNWQQGGGQTHRTINEYEEISSLAQIGDRYVLYGMYGGPSGFSKQKGLMIPLFKVQVFKQ